MKSDVSLHQQKQQTTKILNIMKVTFLCNSYEGEKLKEAITTHNIAKQVDETFTGKFNLIHFDFPYFDLNKLIAISEYLGTYPYMPYFFVDNKQ